MPEQYPIAPIDTQEDYRLPPPPAYPVWTPRKKFQNRRWLHVTLFVLTFLSTTAAGAGHYLGFVSDFGPQIVRMTGPALFLHDDCDDDTHRRLRVQRDHPRDPRLPRTRTLSGLPIL